MKPFSRLVVVLALALAAGACSEQPPCEALPCPLIPAVTLTVPDAMDGGPIADPCQLDYVPQTRDVSLPPS